MMGHSNSAWAQLGTDLYVSGTTLFTLGLGDVVPHSLLARALIIFESGVGLGFVALVIGYLPVLYQAFSHREVSVALLDARAGSPPNAGELLRRHAFEGGQEALSRLLAEWERWSAEILESHISYPDSLLLPLATRQPELALCTCLNTGHLRAADLGRRRHPLTAGPAHLRHGAACLIDLGHVFHIEELKPWQRHATSTAYRPKTFTVLRSLGRQSPAALRRSRCSQRLNTIRALYEPHAFALSEYLRMPLPSGSRPRKKMINGAF